MKTFDPHSLPLIYTSRFPFVSPFRKNHKYRVTLGIGGNVGNCVKRFSTLFSLFDRSPYVHIIATSPLLLNPPFGYTNQDDFTNGVIELSTNFSPYELLKFLHYFEKRLGRKRSFRNAPRTLDLDIIFFETKVVYNDHIQIPHPRWKERESVVVPLLLLGKKLRYRRSKK